MARAAQSRPKLTGRCRIKVERMYLDFDSLSLTPSSWGPCGATLLDGKCPRHLGDGSERKHSEQQEMWAEVRRLRREAKRGGPAKAK